jgi:hypothetical protein
MNTYTPGQLKKLMSEPGSHVVDYTQNLDAMIAAGKYDWKNTDITPERFPIVGKGRVEFEDTLFHFDCDISSEEAGKLIVAADPTNPWELAKIENLLAYGARNPEEQRKFPIIGLGSVAKVFGNRRVACLGRCDAERNLGLYWFDDDWDAYVRFLAVRKRLSATQS